MPRSVLMVYEPLEGFPEKKDYWQEYISFYEAWWGGPTSPYGVWFGNEYDSFKKALSKRIGIKVEEIEDCYFMKGEDQRYYILPIGSGGKSHLLYSKDEIPPHWFILFRDEERDFVYSQWGFGAIHYSTEIRSALDRLKGAQRIIREAEGRIQEKDEKAVFILTKCSEIQNGVTEISDWLLNFDTSGYMILNYWEIFSLFSPHAAHEDRSAKEVWDFLTSLDANNLNEAFLHLQNLVRKWESIKRKAKAMAEADKATIQ